jgi:hypothetical protein
MNFCVLRGEGKRGSVFTLRSGVVPVALACWAAAKWASNADSFAVGRDTFCPANFDAAAIRENKQR